MRRLGLARDVGVEVVLAHVRVVHQVVATERDRTRERKREIADDAEREVLPLLGQDQVVRRFVVQHEEAVIYERAEGVRGHHHPHPPRVAQEERDRELDRDESEHEQRGPRVRAEERPDFRVTSAGCRGRAAEGRSVRRVRVWANCELHG